MSSKSKSFKRPKQPRTTLEEDIANAKQVQPKHRSKKRSREGADDEFVDAKISRKIISSAREQLFEDEEESFPLGRVPKRPHFSSKQDEGDDSAPEEDNLVPDMFFENIQINVEDEVGYDQFMSEHPAPRRQLADYILEKRNEKEEVMEEKLTTTGVIDLSDIDPSVVEMYRNAAGLLRVYKSGKFPKLMKFLPGLKCFETLLEVTDPSSWSAASIYAIARVWVSNYGYEKLRIFYRYILLPRIRDEINGNQRLNFHLYQALRKTLYKPKSFVQEFLLPLCESRDCTLREAIIIGSVLARNSIPVEHSMMAMAGIAEMDYTGANSIFLRILLDKKYSLSLSVIQIVVAHFLRFMNDKRTLPVLWHQCLLTFVQRYKSNINDLESCEGLLDLVSRHRHELITPEIIRELVSIKDMKQEDH